MIFANKQELVTTLIQPTDDVLDIGFYGQGVRPGQSHWVHRLLEQRASSVWGIDTHPDVRSFEDGRHIQANAESFHIDHAFSVIFAGDLIEHVCNPGMFLDACRAHLASGGRLILTTPNCFNLFNLMQKLMRDEPTVNADHVCYFNTKTIQVLLEKCGWKIDALHYLYSLDAAYTESFKKRIQNILYRWLSWYTPKFIETLVVVAVPREGSRVDAS
jgi:SAM-dependent methyltransferase